MKTKQFAVRLMAAAWMFLAPATAIRAQSVGVVFSGGGVRGFAHVGVLKALEENNIPVDFIAGTSAGALVGCNYAIGRSPWEIEKFFTSEEFENNASGTISEDLRYYYPERMADASWVTVRFAYDSAIKTKLTGSLTNSSPADFALLEALTGPIARAGYDFDSLLIPFRCVASDIRAKRSLVLKDGDLGFAVRASMAFPLYFSPLTVKGEILFDGGIYNNFPVDVMLSEFSPDIVIGVNAAGVPEIPSDDNVLSQMKNILVAIEDESMMRTQDILIEPDINSISVFDFTKAQHAIDSGYAATIRIMDDIKNSIGRRSHPDSIRNKRKSFIEGIPPVTIDRIYVYGLSDQQASYVQSVLNPRNECFSMAQLKDRFFLLSTDRQFSYIFPRLVFNRESGFYDLHLHMKKDRDLEVNFGGNLSSKPVNAAFVALQYRFLGKQALSLYANSYFGKLYSSGFMSMRLSMPGRSRLFVETSYSLSQYDYFKSSSTFFEDVKPSFLITTDNDIRFSLGIPVRKKGVLVAFSSFVNNKYNYYQTRDFSQSDTADVTRLSAFSSGLHFDRSTLNRKQYASSGSRFTITGRMVSGREESTPGSTSLLPDTVTRDHKWMQARLLYDNYFRVSGPWTVGIYGDLFLSAQPFFSNYTASILSSPQFTPVPESQTLFLPNFRAHNFVGIGLKNIIQIKGSFEMRLEGFIYQPVQEIIEGANSKARYSEAFLRRYLTGTAALVFNSPVGPVSFSVNYFDKHDKPVSFLFHFGYILFNRHSLD